MDRSSTLSMRGSQTIGAGVAAADDDDVPVLGRDEFRVGKVVPFVAAVLKRKVFHREVDTLQIPSWYREITRHGRAASEDDRVEVDAQLFHGDIDADVGVDLKSHALLLHQAEAAIEEALLQLEVRYSVSEEPADAIGTLEHGHRVACAVELCGCRQSGRPRTDHSDAAPGP